MLNVIAGQFAGLANGEPLLCHVNIILICRAFAIYAPLLSCQASTECLYSWHSTSPPRGAALPASRKAPFAIVAGLWLFGALACGSPPAATPQVTVIVVTHTSVPATGTSAPTVMLSLPTSTATVGALPSATPAATALLFQAASCSPTDQDLYVYHPNRLQVLAACIRVSGVVVAVRNETDGDLHILLNLDTPYVDLLTAANADELGALVVEPVCVRAVSQADAIDICKSDPDPFSGPFPTVGQRVWMEGRYVLDKDHGYWAELHPLYRRGRVKAAPANASAPAATQVPTRTQPQSATEQSTGNCDPSYATVCIPPPPPDLDCGQISFRRFTVLPPDPHGFDGDHDGVGCES